MPTEVLVLNRFSSAKPDGADTTVYRPSDHNASRKFTTGTDGDILLRDSSMATSGASWLASVATGRVLISQGAGSLPAWSVSPSLTTLTLTGQLLAADGSSSAPGWAFSGGPNTGMLRVSNAIRATIAGTEHVDISASNLTLDSIYRLAWAPTTIGSGQDTFFGRDSAAAIQIGVDAGAPIAQTFKAHDGFGTDIAGASLSLAGGNGTGTGLGGALIFKTTPAGSTGSSQNTSTERGRFTSPGHFVLTELTTDPGTGDLAANGAMAVYNKNNKIVFAFNNAGTITYCTLAMDGSSVLWAQGTGAP